MYDEHTRQALHAEWDHCINSPPTESEPAPFHKITPPDDCAFMVADLMAGGLGVWNGNLKGPVSDGLRSVLRVYVCTRLGLKLIPFP